MISSGAKCCCINCQLRSIHSPWILNVHDERLEPIDGEGRFVIMKVDQRFMAVDNDWLHWLRCGITTGATWQKWDKRSIEAIASLIFLPLKGVKNVGSIKGGAAEAFQKVAPPCKAIPVTPWGTRRPAARASSKSQRAKPSNVAFAKLPRRLSIEPGQRSSGTTMDDTSKNHGVHCGGSKGQLLKATDAVNSWQNKHRTYIYISLHIHIFPLYIYIYLQIFPIAFTYWEAWLADLTISSMHTSRHITLHEPLMRQNIDPRSTIGTPQHHLFSVRQSHIIVISCSRVRTCLINFNLLINLLISGYLPLPMMISYLHMELPSLFAIINPWWRAFGWLEPCTFPWC